jgi:enterochelin esterase family protein
MRSFGTSILDVRGPGLTVRDFDPAISHGVVRQHTYYSKALKQTRSLHVYTPPGYDQKRFSKFPVLYLFHGAGDNDATWTSVGRAQWILDNLIAQGKAKPMIIVMTDGHAFVPTGGRPDPGMFLKGVHVFEEDLLGDVLPFVEKNYRARSGSKNRAIAGLSMGGGQSLVIGLNHTDMFAWVAGFSSFVPQPEESVASALADGAQTNKRLKLLWIACGKDDFLLERNKPLDQTLTSHGVSHVFKITEGNHTWPVWRRYLAEVAPQLF